MQKNLNFKAKPLSLVNAFCWEGSPKTSRAVLLGELVEL